ncbi:MAG: EpsG family protein [Bacilli bacterium]
MEIYIMLYLSIIFIGIFSDREVLNINNKAIINPNTLLFGFTGLLFLLAAIRKGIGTDYYLYKGIYNSQSEEMFELGWVYSMLSDFLRFLAVDYQFLIAINSLIFLSVIYYFIKTFSYYKYISLVTLLGTYMYFTSYNTFRQMTSIAIVLIALILFNTQKKKIIGVLVFIISVGLHKSSIMFLPLFLLYYVKLSKLLYATIMIICLIAFIVIPESIKNQIFGFVINANEFFNDKYAGSTFVQGEERGIANKVFFLFYWSISMILVVKNNEQNNNHSWIEQSFLLYFIVNSFLPYSDVVGRISMFFELLIIVIIPKFIFLQRTEYVRNILKIAVIIIFFVRLLYVLFLNGGEVVPYKSILNLH